MRLNKPLKIFIVITFLYLVFVLFNVFTSPNTLERGDNYFNIADAKGLLKYDLKPLADFDLFFHKSNVVLNHPPIYLYLFAFILYIFKSPLALNLLMPVFMILSGFLLIKILELRSKKISDFSRIIVYFSFLFTPLILQGSYLIDFDVILATVMLLFVYFYLKNPERIFLNSFLFSLIWFAKVQGIPMVVAALFFYLIFNKKSKKKCFNAVLVVLGGTIFFLAVMYVYSILMDVNFLRIFAHSSIFDVIKKQLINPQKAVLTSIWSLKQVILWVVPGVFLFYLLGVYDYFKNLSWKEDEKILLPILVSIFALLELVPIGTYGWNFPKYYMEFVPFMFIAIAPLVNKINWEKKDLKKIPFIFIVILLYFFIIPDPFIPEVNEAFTQKDYISLIGKVLINFDLMALPLFLVFIFYRGWKKDEKNFYKILAISSIVMFFSIGIVQITKPYSTNNLYGDSHEDLEKTIKYLKENTSTQDRALLFAHVGYYFGNEDNSNWYNSMLCFSVECIKNLSADADVRFMQFYPKDLKRLDGKIGIEVAKNFELEKQFGDYLIYGRKE